MISAGALRLAKRASIYLFKVSVVKLVKARRGMEFLLAKFALKQHGTALCRSRGLQTICRMLCLAQPWKIRRTQRAAIKREEECIFRFHPRHFLFSWNSIICALPTIQPTRLCSAATKGATLLEKVNLAHRWHAFILRVGALLVCT